jgi:hypothetical protein
VYAVPKASRPAVETYLPKPAIDAHLAEFDAGASRFMTESNLAKYGPAQRDGTAFVMPKAQADKLLADAAGDAAKLEESLGLPANSLANNPLVRVDVPRPRDLNLRMSDGTQAGANSQWMPGGYLPNGQIEAVLDLGVTKPGAYTTTPVVTGAPGVANPLRAGQLHEAEQLARLGVEKNNLVFRPSVEQANSAAFKVIVGEPKYTPGGQLKGTIFDGAENGYLEIKGGKSELNSTYQLRLQTYKATIDNKPFTIQTTRPVNSQFQTWLDTWGVNVVKPK